MTIGEIFETEARAERARVRERRVGQLREDFQLVRNNAEWARRNSAERFARWGNRPPDLKSPREVAAAAGRLALAAGLSPDLLIEAHA
jgi:hypothetical protein